MLFHFRVGTYDASLTGDLRGYHSIKDDGNNLTTLKDEEGCKGTAHPPSLKNEE
jgi:hypothetical protein